jgi:type I restriction enzyme S subunit
VSLPAYPAYRDSGLPWLGQVPAGWSVRRLRFLADIRPSGVDKHSLEGELPVRLCNYVDVYKNERITDALAFLEATATPAEIERFSLRAGDVLITKDSETPDDIAAAALVKASASGVVCGYHLALLRPVPGVVDGAFLFWAFKSPETLAQCTVRAQGITRFGLSSAAIGDVVLPLPPPAEQRAIAAFLDRACQNLDTLTTEAERAIALLKERRAALISAAVTGKIDVRGLAAPAETEATAA